MLQDDEVRHIAKLARISLRDDEVKKFAGQLSSVLGYVEILQEVDTEGVEATSQVTGLKNVRDKDEGAAGQSTAEELLEATSLPVENNQIRVLPAIKQ